jgi:hypothetical protein
MDEAAGKLRGAIQSWMDGDESTPSGTHPITSPPVNRQRGTVGLSKEQANQWLGAVLAAWVAFVRVHLRDRASVTLDPTISNQRGAGSNHVRRA